MVESYAQVVANLALRDSATAGVVVKLAKQAAAEDGGGEPVLMQLQHTTSKGEWKIGVKDRAQAKLDELREEAEEAQRAVTTQLAVLQEAEKSLAEWQVKLEEIQGKAKGTEGF
jgi:hypothetical protein